MHKGAVLLNGQKSFYAKYIKRVMDIVLAMIALIILSPIMLIVAILVKMKMGGPVLFKQERPGKNEEIFQLYKFRTMTNEKDEHGDFLPDEMRLTQFGKFLRASSLDELPELINIIRGDMSIVGPRPLAKVYLPYYYPHERIRHVVRPGLTGLAQVNGRNALSWEEKFAYDIDYVNRMSFLLDLKIIFLTIGKVLAHSDIGQAEQAPTSLHILRQTQEVEEKL